MKGEVVGMIRTPKSVFAKLPPVITSMSFVESIALWLITYFEAVPENPYVHLTVGGYVVSSNLATLSFPE